MWLDQIKNLIAREGVPTSTWNLSSMSATELRQAVARPYRFEKSITAQQEPSLTPVFLMHESPVVIHTAEMLPGGRWLILIGETLDEFTKDPGQVWAEVWDLQSPGQAVSSVLFRPDIDPCSASLCADANRTGAMLFLWATEADTPETS